MSFDRLNRLRRTTGVRLTAGFAGLFVVGTLGLFVLAYVLLAGSLRQRDRGALRTELQDMKAEYDEGGRAALAEEVREGRADPRVPLFVQLVSPQHRVLFSHPAAWRPPDVAAPQGARAQTLYWTTAAAQDGGEVLEIASLPLTDGNVLRVGASTAPREKVMERFRRIFLPILLVLLLLGIASGALFARQALRPLRQLAEAVRAITRTGDVRQRVPTRHTNDELDELVQLFNGMLARIEEVIAGMHGALDNVAHDLRTPLTRLRGAAELALHAEATPQQQRAALSDCLEESEDVLLMLNTLMDVAEAEAGTIRLHRRRVSLQLLTAHVVDLYEHVAEEKRIRLRSSIPEQLYVAVDASRMQQALANLVDNALKYTPPGGQVDIEAMQETGQIALQVRDTGTGIAPEDQPRIWDRLYRGDRSRSGRGFGLGLSVVKAIVEAHGGRVSVESRLRSGSIFTIYVPGSSDGAATGALQQPG